MKSFSACLYPASNSVIQGLGLDQECQVSTSKHFGNGFWGAEELNHLDFLESGRVSHLSDKENMPSTVPTDTPNKRRMGMTHSTAGNMSWMQFAKSMSSMAHAGTEGTELCANGKHF